MKRKDPLSQSAQFVKGVGPKKIKILNRLDIKTIENLLYYFPYRYEDRSHLKTISNLEPGKFQSLKADVLTLRLQRIRRGKSIFEMTVGDDTGNLSTTWFNQPYMKDYFKVGDKVILYGKVQRRKSLQIVNPEYEIISKRDTDDAIHINRIVPIYSLIKGVSQRSLRKIMYASAHDFAPFHKEFLPDFLRQKYNLLHITASLKNIHFPKNKFLLKKARYRLIFEEFFKFQLIMASRRIKMKSENKGIAYKRKGKLMDDFNKLLPFKLTSSQSRVIEQIQNDMEDPKQMQRLLQGDVGSGKTIVAIYAILFAVENGYQTALMVPTEILAEQHYLTLSQLLLNLKVNVVLLVSGMNNKEKEIVKKLIESHEADIIIGTHALIQENIKFKKLGLIVIDEQHKFGVIQRKTLKEKGLNPDVLVMTATPIPRTLAYTIYGDLDLSVIDELPPGRKPIVTWWVTEKKRQGAYEFIRKELRAKKQAYVVYPLIEESDKLELRAAKNMHKNLKDKIFPEFKVGLIHGQMKSKEKESAMNGFKSGKINILVSTIVIEVGIDIPNASVMLIEHAERFGLSQLHQLRGRIGRGRDQSYCILVSSSNTEAAKERLSSMSKYSDGFKIAEEDLRLRGPGEFFGTRQHGYPELKIGNILTDIKLLELARFEAFDLVEKDPELKRPENKILFKRYVAEYISIRD